MKNQMMVFLTSSPATPQWGEKAQLSFSQNGATIHLLDEESGNEALDTLTVVQKAARKIASQGIKHVVLEGEQWDIELIWAYMQGFRDPKAENSVDYPMLKESDHNELLARMKVSRWVCAMTNGSAEDIMPSQFVAHSVEFISSITTEEQLNVRVIKGKDLLEEGWNGLYTVGRGSKRSPTMLQLDYNPTGDENAPVFAVLVGKGITFDSGGYSLKPSAMMEAMRTDMGGAALVTGALGLAILRGLKKRVKLVLCCAENMVSDRSVKLGDIITYKNGCTVEVLNTDAEGRLVLADGLIYAEEQNPEFIIDCATLTGAAKNALGNEYHALFSFDQPLSTKVLNIAKKEQEGLWQLPLEPIHRTMFPSNYATIANVGSGSYIPGASTAAAFLSYFIKDYKTNWLHFDCSAAYHTSSTALWQVGATAIGIRTIASLLLEKE